MGGVFETFYTWMCLPDFKKLTFSIPIFINIYHPSVYQFCQKTPNFAQIRCFSQNLLKIHPIYVNWVPLSVMKTHPLLYHNLWRSTPNGRRQAHICVPYQCETPLLNYSFPIPSQTSMVRLKSMPEMTYFVMLFVLYWFVSSSAETCPKEL